MMMNNDLNVLDSKEVKAHATADDPYAKKWLASNGAGHGAYTVQTWDPGNQIVLSRFPDYYGTPGNFDTIVYKAVPEGANRAALVQAGSVDVAENVPYRNLSDMEGDGAVKIWKTVGNRLFRFELNNASPPLDDVRVRQALLYATPVNDLLDSLFFGFASQERSPVPSSYNGYNGDYWNYEQDPDKARDLLSQAGLADGFDLTITIDSSFELMSDTATILKTAFADVGVNVTINEVSSATYSTQVYQRKYDAFFLLEFPILPDPGYALALNYPSDSFLNSTAYSNDQVDSLIKEGFSTLEADARDQIYSQIQEIMVAQDPPEVWIAQPGWQLVTKPDLQGVSWSTWEGYDMAQLRF
jgi:peptide/nickel transport system substrate-binding protein